jgi:hypothetical protein
VRYLLLALAACASVPAAPTRPVAGSITGLARDHDSGDAIGQAQIHVRAQGVIAPLTARTSKTGDYAVAHLAPGTYSVTASFGGQSVTTEHVIVKAGSATVVDMMFTLGHPDPITIDFGNPKDSEIDRYKHGHAVIEGTISDRASHDRVAGAVVTAIRGTDTLQAVSDDEGRYRFDPVPPGNYIVSAYYAVDSHAQIEVRRSDIEVPALEGVIVPLWIETER